jgi:hypothetical protein
MTTEDRIRADVGAWLHQALEDAGRRGLPVLKPLLEALAESTVVLRRAEWNDEVDAGLHAADGGDDAP